MADQCSRTGIGVPRAHQSRPQPARPTTNRTRSRSVRVPDVPGRTVLTRAFIACGGGQGSRDWCIRARASRERKRALRWRCRDSRGPRRCSCPGGLAGCDRRTGPSRPLSAIGAARNKVSRAGQSNPSPTYGPVATTRRVGIACVLKASLEQEQYGLGCGDLKRTTCQRARDLPLRRARYGQDDAPSAPILPTTGGWHSETRLEVPGATVGFRPGDRVPGVPTRRNMSHESQFGVPTETERDD